MAEARDEGEEKAAQDPWRSSIGLQQGWLLLEAMEKGGECPGTVEAGVKICLHVCCSA